MLQNWVAALETRVSKRDPMAPCSQAQPICRYTKKVSATDLHACRRRLLGGWNDMRLRLVWTGARLRDKMVYHSHADLLAHLRRTGVLRTKRVEEAMASVDRALFVPGGLPAYAVGPLQRVQTVMENVLVYSRSSNEACTLLTRRCYKGEVPSFGTQRCRIGCYQPSRRLRVAFGEGACSSFCP